MFHCPVRLTRLKEVNLKYNRIQTLEPWPIYLGFNEHIDRIDLRFNNISSFSNMMGCKLHCNRTAVVPTFHWTLGIKHVHKVTQMYECMFLSLVFCK